MSSEKSPKLYGITQDPESKDYILVMQYASGGDLRQYLQDNFVEIDWYQKISMLLEIANGLKAIHDYGYIVIFIAETFYWIFQNLLKKKTKIQNLAIQQKYDINIRSWTV